MNEPGHRAPSRDGVDSGLDPEATVRIERAHSASAGSALAEDAAEAGTLEIAETVLVKIAVAAAGGVEHVGGAARRVLGVTVGSEDPEVAVRAGITRRDPAAVTVELSLSVTYPAPIARVVEKVRRTVAERLATLAGVDVDRVEVTVTALHNPQDPVRTLA